MSRHPEIMASIVGAFVVVIVASRARADAALDSAALAPPPAEPASVCTATRSLGGLTSCKPSPLWYEHAHQDCVARGYPKVGEITYGEACWKGFRAIEYTCCN
ncbi:MAG: hypothetical protein ABJE95_32720 [Byssovorax sp.]